MQPLALVVAMNKEGCIGVAGGLPWHYSEDLKFFKRITTGHAMIMGRKTYDSIGRPLPNRRTIVVSRQPGLTIAGCDVAPDLQTAIRMAREGGDKEPRIVGGGAIYKEALPYVTKMYITEVDQTVGKCDTLFPSWNMAEWREAERTPGEDPRLQFVTWERK